jgi:proline iminopeptidase
MNRIKVILGIAILSLFLTSCESKSKIKDGEGFVEVTGGKIWYRVTGHGNKTPILMLHGGPGGTSYYLNPLMDIGKERSVITFDQLGCGRSDRVTDTTLMTVDSYVEQTKKLLHHLGVNEFYLYSHSWGSMLATEYYLKYRDGIKGLILASPILSSKLWATDADTLIASLPDSISVILRNDIRGLTQDSAALNTAMDFYFKIFGTKKRPLSADLDSSFSQSAQNVSTYLWGTSEFFINGALKNYDRTNDLQNINTPTLYIIGEFDEVRPPTVTYYQSVTPNSTIAIIKDAGHMTMQDNPAENINAISNFLTEQDKK